MQAPSVSTKIPRATPRGNRFLASLKDHPEPRPRPKAMGFSIPFPVRRPMTPPTVSSRPCPEMHRPLWRRPSLRRMGPTASSRLCLRQQRRGLPRKETALASSRPCQTLRRRATTPRPQPHPLRQRRARDMAFLLRSRRGHRRRLPPQRPHRPLLRPPPRSPFPPRRQAGSLPPAPSRSLPPRRPQQGTHPSA